MIARFFSTIPTKASLPTRKFSTGYRPTSQLPTALNYLPSQFSITHSPQLPTVPLLPSPQPPITHRRQDLHAYHTSHIIHSDNNNRPH
jgi:hypothetical protein